MHDSLVSADLAPIEALRGRSGVPEECVEALGEAATLVVEALGAGGTLFITGNGGSMADALHIAGELTKSFERPRPLPTALQVRLRGVEGGAELAEHLEAGLRVQVIGADPVLATAVDNDIVVRHLGFAQHLVSLARPGDVLLAISTSGRSVNVTNAARAARALDVPVVVLTGSGETTDLMRLAQVVVRAPSRATAEVQGHHGVLYHALCRAVEDSFFPA